MIAETRPPKGYRHGTLTIERWELVDGERVVTMAEVPGLIADCGFLGLHKPVVEGFGLWSVTHLPSGKLIATLPTQAAGKQCIGLLAPLREWESFPATFSNLCSQVTAIVSNLRSQLAEAATPSPRQKSGKQRASAPSSCSPVLPPGLVPTPKTRAALNEAAVALGQAFSGSDRKTDVFASLEAAASVLWREEIVVRVTQPPRAILLEGDIPSSPTPTSCEPQSKTPMSLPPSSGTTLRDGTPATPGEFRRRYALLLELGDRLRAGSLIFRRFHAEGEREGWTVARLEKWEQMDERFRSIVCEGWMVWSGAAFCLAVNPAFLANVEAKLGYVGSTGRGWHELGVKTFLRHPEIAEVQPLRREMKEKIQEEL
jgi:hypothetical protein